MKKTLNIKEYFDLLLAKMQTKVAKKGAAKLFSLTPEELGEAAIQAAKKEKK